MPNSKNHLSGEQSPYLLQHAGNPVHWYPWGEEPFARARMEDKPVFLSIGYATCHWCHVMAGESFENEQIAAILNRSFISIKVDREERPDVDQVYMAVTQAVTGSGGWPMSVFLLPDGRAFHAGTYFPPQSTVQRPGFRDLLEAIAGVWRQDRQGLEDTAARLLASLQRANQVESSPVSTELCGRCLQLLEQSFDSKRGGFGDAPKFPRPALLSFLFSHGRVTGASKASAMALATLRAMGGGGIHDQLGGGFHRYSVDGSWFVPHFEKMLYDQAQLACAYLEGFQQSGDPELARVAREILVYVLRDLSDPAGGFYSAEDADSNDPYTPGRHGEGAWYLWTEEEIVKTIGSRAAQVFNFVHGVQFAGNVEQDPLGEFRGRNILHLFKSREEAAAEFDLGEQAVADILAQSRDKLLARRNGRQRPHCDDKVITGWNGMMLGALARASQVLAEPSFLEAARRAARFLREQLRDPADGRLLRRWRRGVAGIPAQLDDFVFLVAGLLDLYEADGNREWLDWATSLTGQQIALFLHEQGACFYDGLTDPLLPIRLRGEYDGAEPAGNSVAAMNLLRLGKILGRSEWLVMAKRLVAAFGPVLRAYPPALPLMLVALQRMETEKRQDENANPEGDHA